MQLELIGCNSMLMGTLIMIRLSGECFITALHKSEIEAKWNISVMEKNKCARK